MPQDMAMSAQQQRVIWDLAKRTRTLAPTRGALTYEQAERVIQDLKRRVRDQRPREGAR